MVKQANPQQLDADIVVVGYGSAGAVAAITAHDAGAQVIILEKQADQVPITNSFMSGGGIVCPNDAKAAKLYMEALTKINDDLYWTDPDIVDIWAKYTMENNHWLQSMGAEIELGHHGGMHKLPGVESIDSYRVKGMGPGLMRLLYDQVKARNIQVMYNIPANELVINSKREVVGVNARENIDGRKEVNVSARRAVILASGGFEFDEQMKLQYLKVYPSHFSATPANTGDGVRMALNVGADLWHMNCVAGGFRMKFHGILPGLAPALGGKSWISPGGSALPDYGGRGWQSKRAKKMATVGGYIIVDRYGNRFTNENYKSHALYYELPWFDTQKLFYPRVPSYWIFDQKRIDDGPLVLRIAGPAGPARLCQWSTDNKEELEQGWIKRGDSAKDLAIELGMEPQILEETINNYNLYCQHGEDAECDRQPNTLMALDAPPYYAVELWPGGVNTQGGPRRNSRAQILRADGSPVPGLYSSGELGSMYGMLYPSSGGNLAECIAFGRIAGENASEESPS